MQKKYSVLIAEDMAPARNLLMNFLSHWDIFENISIAVDGKQALEKLSEEDYDLLFLDIDLPVIPGIEVLERLNKKLPYVIFTTAYNQYAIQAFDFGAVDYLLKPYTQSRFNKAIERFKKKIESDEPFNFSLKKHSLYFREDGGSSLVAYKDILYLTSHGKHTIIHTEEKDYEAVNILKEIQEKLPEDIFIRIHKKHIVNINYIVNLEYDAGGQYLLYLKDSNESVLPVGKTFAKMLKEKLHS